jgi:hypothetical protein
MKALSFCMTDKLRARRATVKLAAGFYTLIRERRQPGTHKVPGSTEKWGTYSLINFPTFKKKNPGPGEATENH